MSRCETCPAASRNGGPPCYGQVANLCGRASYVDVIAREDARRVDRPSFVLASSIPRVPLPSYPRGGIAQLWPMAFIGGAERAMISVRKMTPDLPWRGIALASNGNDPAIVAELAELGPVAQGELAVKTMIDGADILIVWAIGNVPSWLPKSCRKPKVVSVSHSTADSSWAAKVMRSDTGIDRYVAVSESALGPIPVHRRSDAVVIPNVVDPSRLTLSGNRESIRGEWGIPSGAKVLGCLNRLSSEKNPRALAEAIACLPDDWFGVMVGEGSERADLESHASEIAPGRVIFPGSRSDVGDVLAAFDTLLVASRYESFCLTLAEALWVGVAALSTPVGVAAENSHLVRSLPSEPSGRSIAAAISRDAQDRHGTAFRVAHGRDEARRLWNPDTIASSWSSYLTGLMPTPPPKFPECGDRGRKTGCSHAICERFAREVHISECLACVLQPR